MPESHPPQRVAMDGMRTVPSNATLMARKGAHRLMADRIGAAAPIHHGGKFLTNTQKQYAPAYRYS